MSTLLPSLFGVEPLGTFAPSCSTGTFAAILADWPGATLNYVEAVPQNGSFGDAATNLLFPFNATQLPALCAVGINVKSSANSSYNFGLFLPDTTWNGRMMTTGNGGFGGGINWMDMGVLSQYGFATVSTDTGHSSSGYDTTWGANAPQALFDWGYRALHGSVVISKDIVNKYYADIGTIQYSYYAGCSMGGRQGLTEVSLHPESFDGISIGAPAWWVPHLTGALLYWGLSNYPTSDPKHIDPSLYEAIVAEVTAQCDGQDGLVDGIISDAHNCHFDFDALLCTPTADPAACLTPAQLVTIKQFHSDWVAADGTFVYPGATLGTDPTALLGDGSSAGLQVGLFRDWVYNDTEWDYTKFTYKDVLFADTVDPGSSNTAHWDRMAAFHARGGKFLHYHGEADPAIPSTGSVYYREQLLSTLAKEEAQPGKDSKTQNINKDANAEDFYRLFLIPGMNHCYGSISTAPAPWYISGAAQTMPGAGLAGATHSVPGFEDADHDVILALARWVERGVAPDRIVATKFRNETVADGVQSQRPLCRYPGRARFVGGAGADPDVAESWVCEGC